MALLVVGAVAGLGLLFVAALTLGVVAALRLPASADARPTANAPATAATVRPTALATGAAANGVGLAVLRDDFNTPERSSLPDGQTDGASYQFADGAYVMTSKLPNYIVWSPFDGSYRNAAVEFDLVFDEGPDDAAAGLLFHYQDPNNYYFFNVSGDGHYALDVQQNGQWNSLIEWTESTEIRGDGAVNRLRLETRNETIRLYVNGTLLAETIDTTFREGGMAFAVNTFDAGGATVVFDNLIVRAKQ